MALRDRAIIQFPGLVLGQQGVGVTKQNGTWVFAFDYSTLDPDFSLTDTSEIAFLDPASGAIRRTTFANMLSIIGGGLKGITPKGAYDNSTSYNVNDLVSYGGGSYIALVQTVGHLPTDTDYWALVVEKGAEGDIGVPGVAGANAGPQGRLTLSSVAAVASSDIATATSIYYLPSGGALVPVWDGAAFQWYSIGTGLTLALDSNSGHAGYQAAAYNYDLFIVNDAGTIRLVTGPTWAVGATPAVDANKDRATGTNSSELDRQDGFLVNKNDITVRFGTGSGDTLALAAKKGTYVGSFRPTADGVATDTAVKRLLFNVYNQTDRYFKRVDASSNWSWSTSSYRIFNNSTDNQLSVLFGLTGPVVDLTATAFLSTSTSTARNCLVGIGVDSITSANGAFAYKAARENVDSVSCRYTGSPGLGFTTFAPLEYGGGTDTQTWWSGGNIRGRTVM